MSRSVVGTALIWAGLLAVLTAQAVLAMRMAKLQDQVGRLAEDRPSAPAPPDRAAGSGSGDGGTATAADAGHAGGGPPGTAAAAPAGGGADTSGNSQPAPDRRDLAARAPGGGGYLTADEVEKLVEKKLAEQKKKNPIVELLDFEDPVAVMERELKLSPIQKTRILEHRKERDDAAMAIWQEGDPRKDWKAMQEKQEELGKRYEENVKRELDLAQQEKYDELKRTGKLVDFGGGGAVSFVVDRKVEDGEEEKK